MNSWREVWNGYFDHSNRWKVLVETYLHAPWSDRIFLIVVTAGFFLSGWCYFVFFRPALFATMAFEGVFLVRLFILKDNLVLEEFGDRDQSQEPPDTDAYRNTRYLMFKKALVGKGLTRSHVADCFELVDIQVDIASTSGQNHKKFFGFSIGVFLGLLGAVWRGTGGAELFYAGTSILAVGLLGTILISAFPSKIEQLKEMKYFMKLYCREVT